MEQNDISIGWATGSITPEKTLSLAGQFHVRIAEKVHDPIMATALALESKNGNGKTEQSIMLTCEVVGIHKFMLEKLRARLSSLIPDFDVSHLTVNATHTHTGPVLMEGQYPEQGSDVMSPPEYIDYFVQQASEVAAEAWKNRKPGGISWGLGQAIIGHNRRVRYADGTAQMYGAINQENFIGFEGSTDHDIPLLFTYDINQKLTGVVINISCPIQISEQEYFVSADAWCEIKENIKKSFGDNIFVLPQVGAGGDQAPRALGSRKATEQQHNLAGLNTRQEIARRVEQTVTHVQETAKQNINSSIPFSHKVKELNLTSRKISQKEYENSCNQVELVNKGEVDEKIAANLKSRHKKVIDRYKNREKDSGFPMELHVIRIGECVFTSNPFELFVDYGVRIKARGSAFFPF